MEDYRSLPDELLITKLLLKEDRLPRVAVDEIIRRGPRMIGRLSAIVSDDDSWYHDLPEWWGVVHAVYLLGAIGTSGAVLPLLRSLRFADAADCDWVTQDLPSIFGAVGLPAHDGLRRIATDETSGWFTRTLALEGLAAISLRHHELIDETLDLVRSVLADPGEDRRLRQSAGLILLDFVRPQDREALLSFAAEERARKTTPPDERLSQDAIEIAFRRGVRNAAPYTRDWLSFYDPAEIAARQRRWAEEEQRETRTAEEEEAGGLVPFARMALTVGKNDPCPCGSGKQYRKCCGIIH